LFPALILGGNTLGCFQALGAALCRDNSGKVGQLLRLHRQQLIAGLRRLERSAC